jgi:transcription elongation GreA/GreB family factor
MEAAQASANDETKSSAGDKYETGRSMMQLELEKQSSQLAEAIKLQQTLDRISLERSDTVRAGSLVTTNQGIFFLAVSAGQVNVEGITAMAISMASPVGTSLRDRKVGEHFVFSGKRYQVEKIE